MRINGSGDVFARTLDEAFGERERNTADYALGRVPVVHPMPDDEPRGWRLWEWAALAFVAVAAGIAAGWPA